MLSVRSSRRIVLVAERGSEVLGFVIAYKHRERAYVDSLAVDPAYRDLGIGGRLLSGLEELLAKRGVERIALSVKDSNLRALDFYLRRGYGVVGLILFMYARTGSLPAEAPPGYELRLRDAPLRGRLKRYKPTTMWSTLTEPVDRMIYKKYGAGEKTLTAYKSGRVRGVAEFSADDEVFADYVALSSYSSVEALRALLKGFRDFGLEAGIDTLVIPVDSSKQVVVEELSRSGFRTLKTEYLLEKELAE
ncbi:GCN5-related N-acetyltransferase [Thermofilum pendens Hrk 5]|uniref:GCN5-related N-acetyltransferase n=1 Tax=Thermofilum pendens (strain DSM 2475 / Hrk 5) TaxID=368408 RepID=A1S0Q9_THEPD|nr:GCN5-related N-acetyltransferase [Thermofilum pendens Hrk 5]